MFTEFKAIEILMHSIVALMYTEMFSFIEPADFTRRLIDSLTAFTFLPL